MGHLQSTWRNTLASAISRASGIETLPEDVTEALLGLDSPQYAAVDRAIRYGDWDMGLGRVAREPVALALAACRTCLSQNSLVAAGLGKLHLASAIQQPD